MADEESTLDSAVRKMIEDASKTCAKIHTDAAQTVERFSVVGVATIADNSMALLQRKPMIPLTSDMVWKMFGVDDLLNGEDTNDKEDKEKEA